MDESETKQYRWKLESLSDECKDQFLSKVRESYQKFMAISMPENLVNIQSLRFLLSLTHIFHSS